MTQVPFPAQPRFAAAMVGVRHAGRPRADLRRGLFALDDPAAIARSLQRSAGRGRRRKAEPFRSAMSAFHLHRAGSNLPKRRRAILERAKRGTARAAPALASRERTPSAGAPGRIAAARPRSRGFMLA